MSTDSITEPEHCSEETFCGADLLVKALADLKVQFIFGYPGGAVLDIYDALFKQEAINHILVRHEQAATHMADGYARSTGEVGVVLATSGPGATNCVTGIATAYMDSIPMVVLSGQVASTMIGEDAFQETDMIGCSRPIVKHSFSCRSTEEIPAIVAKAFYLASTGRPGPVVVEFPKDMVNPANKVPYVLPASCKMRSYNPIKAGHRKQVRKAVTAILEAKRPVFYTGGGIILSDASEGLTRLVERLNVPVTNTLMGLGGISGEHANFVGMLGMHGSFEANKAMANADVIVALGARFDDRVTNNVKKFCPNANIVHVDVDPTVISKTVNAHIPVVGSVERVIEQMQSEIDKREASELENSIASRDEWWQQINTWRQRTTEKYQKSNEVIKPQAVVECLYEVTQGEAYISADVGQHQMFAAQYYPFKRPRQWINSGGLGTMGFGFPAAMGVQLAFPDAISVCVTGDGSIQMNIQELATCLQYGIPVKIISLNNRALGMVRQWQDMIYNGRHSHSYMDSLPDFVKLVESYGHVGMRVEHPSELRSTLEKAFELKDRLVFVDVVVDQSEHVYPMQVRHGAVDEMWLRKGERA